MTPYIIETNYDTKTINFADPKAVKALNSALLKSHYHIDYWEFPDANLCPPIPGRVDYIHYVNDVLQSCKMTGVIKVLDIGTGASCIYPLLGQAVYDWKFVGTDVDQASLMSAQKIIDNNNLEEEITLRHQKHSSKIFEGVLIETDAFSVSMCNPPFYRSEEEALEATRCKLKGLNTLKEKVVRNFSGKQNELWYPGGEKAFIHNYLYESSLYKDHIIWFTTLVSKNELVRGIHLSLKKLGATHVRTINMSQGNKKSRLVAWTYKS